MTCISSRKSFHTCFPPGEQFLSTITPSVLAIFARRAGGASVPPARGDKRLPGRDTGRWIAVLRAASTCLIAGTVACSTSGLAVRSMIPVLENARDAALGSPDLKTFSNAAPSNLFLLEGLIRSKPKEKRLRLSASMLYFSYAFAFVEEEDQSYASFLYLKGLEHGKEALFSKRQVRDGWSGPLDAFSSSLEALDKRDVPSMVWTAANWSQFVSLHLDSTAILADIPRVITLLVRACELDGSYLEGLPHVILGSLHAFRPPLMGGSPEESRKHFDLATGISKGRFLLTRYFFAKYYCYRVQDAGGFERSLEEVLAQSASILPRYQLLNEIAKRKARVLLGKKDKLF